MTKTTTKTQTGKGGRPRKDASTRLSERIQGRVTVETKLTFIAKAEAAGMSEGEFIQALAEGVEIRSPHRGSDPELVQAIRALERELNAIGNNVNQIALAANSGRDIPFYWREVGEQLRTVLDGVLDRMD